MQTTIMQTTIQTQKLRGTSERNGNWMARGLGLVSLGVGLPSVAAPDALARVMGMPDDSATRTAISAIGVRETANGLGLLVWPRFAGWGWARVVGDAMDLALLGWTLATPTRSRGARTRTIATTAATAGIAALDVWTALRLSRRARLAVTHQQGDSATTARRAITINRSRDEIYKVWRDFRNLPRFMENLESVEITGDTTSRWVARAPGGKSIAWDAEIVDDQPNERISWRALPGSRVENSGTVRFVTAPGGKGTEVHVEIRYTPPAGRLGATIAKIFGVDAGQQTIGDLRRFKQVMETGEIARSDVTARGGGPAQPLKTPGERAAIHLPGEPVRS